MNELTDALNTAIKGQMKNSKTTKVEPMIKQELGDPFRQDAMSEPMEVVGSVRMAWSHRRFEP